MTTKQYAEFIAEELAGIAYTLASTKLMQKVKDAKIPEGFVRMSREMFKGNSHQVAVECGGKLSVPDTGSQTLKMQSSQKTGGSKSSQKVEWASYGSKHKAKSGIPWKKIVKSTESGVAKYKPEINIKEIELHAWYNGKPVTTIGKNFKVFKSDSIIGAKWGKQTFYMRVECSSNTIHGHPISESEYLKYLRKK